MGRKWAYDANGDIVTLADVWDTPRSTGGSTAPAIDLPEDPFLDPALADDEPPF